MLEYLGYRSLEYQLYRGGTINTYSLFPLLHPVQSTTGSLTKCCWFSFTFLVVVLFAALRPLPPSG
jgi:hypothetical protein